MAQLGFQGTERFEVMRLIGEGGMGVVYEAYDRERKQTVALKTLKSFSARDLLGFKKEFRALHDVVHPNLISIYDFSEKDTDCFFTMELVRGLDFVSYVRSAQEATRPPGSTSTSEQDSVPGYHEPKLRAAFRQLAQGIAALHAAGMVHRDIKPSNILVTEEGRVVLVDFGLVTAARKDDQSTNNKIVGTVEYMAPEQAMMDDVGPETDWYSAAVVLFEALTGQLPHSGKTPLQMMMNKQLYPPPPPRQLEPNVAADLDDLCVQLLSTEPRKRPDTDIILSRLGVNAELEKRTNPPSSSIQAFTESITFVGREDELELLRAAFEESKNKPVVAIVEGGSGLGKSELVGQFCRGLVDESPDAVVLAGRCYERETVAYKAFDGIVDELSRFMTRLPKEQASGLLPVQAGLLPRLFPVLAQVKAIAGAPKAAENPNLQEMRRQMFGALREMLVRLSMDRSLVLTVDDMQWTDADSLILLQEVFSAEPSLNLLLIITMRPVTEAKRKQILAAMGSLKQRHIPLAPFRFEQARELAATLLPKFDEEELSIVARESGGHPLFVMELAHYAQSHGKMERQTTSLDEALRQRILQLPESLQCLLEILCVAGVPLTRETAADAAEISPADFSAAASGLRFACFVRTSGTRKGDLIEPYHDRIRETVVSQMEHDRQVECHRRLAIALQETGAAKSAPQALVHHTEASGDKKRAAEHAEAAAEHAVDAMAFDRAAMFLQTALQLGEYGEAKNRELRLKYAEALVNAGRGLEAAETFVVLSEGAEPALRRYYQRRAAEQWLFTGQIDRGLDMIDKALTEIKEPILSSPIRAIAALLWRRAWLKLRGLAWKERAPSEISFAEMARLEVLNAAAFGLIMVGNIRGTAFATRYLQVALNVGNALHLGRALTLEASFIASTGRRKPADRLARGVEKLVQSVRFSSANDKSYLLSGKNVVDGMIHYFAGRFRAGYQLLTETENQFQQIPRTNHDRSMFNVFRVCCLRHIGEFKKLGFLVDSLCRDAERRGDLFLSTSVRRYGGRYIFLSQDRPEEARDDLSGCTWSAPRSIYHLQDWFELEARLEIALYTGDAALAQDRMHRELSKLQQSIMLRRTQIVRVLSRSLRGRLLLTASPEPARLRHVTKISRRLVRERVGYAEVCAHLLLAAVAHQRSQPEVVVAKLREAISAAEENEMALHLAAARRKLGKILDGDEGAVLLAASDAWMEQQEIVNPERMCEIVAPGFSNTVDR